MIRSARRALRVLALVAAASPAALAVLAAPKTAWPAPSSSLLPQVEDVRPTGYRVRVPLGDPEVTRGNVHGYELAEVTLPLAPLTAGWGTPALPSRAILLRIPWGVAATARISYGPARSLGSIRPVPIPYLLTDPRAREKVDASALEAALRYMEHRRPGGRRGADAPVPRAVGAGVDRYMVVELRPVEWNPSTGLASVAGDATVEVEWDRPVTTLSDASTARPMGLSLSPRAAVGPRYAPRQARLAPERAAATGPMRVDPTRPWVRLDVLRPGLYTVGPADLAATGVSTAGIDPTSFRIFRATPGDIPADADVDQGPDSLRECAIEVTGAVDASFDPADRIYFWGTGSTGFGYDLVLGGGAEYQEAEHSDVESYWLTWGPAPSLGTPRRVSPRPAAPMSVGAPLFTSVTHRVHLEQNRVEQFDLFSPPTRWERWFERLILQGATIRVALQPPGGIDGTATSVRVRLWGVGNSLGAGLPDHVGRIYWNGALVDTAGWDLFEPQDLTASGLELDGPDTLDIQVPALVDPGPFPARLDRSYLAWLEISYARGLTASADTVHFAAPDSLSAGRVQYRIDAIGDSAAAWLLDRTDPESPTRLLGGTWSGAAPSFTLTVEDSAGPGYRPRYSLVSTARAARPFRVARYAPPSGPHAIGDLTDPGNGADYLIVAPPTLLAAAESLAAFRSLGIEGMPSPRVRIATTDRLFAQFGSGRPSPVAIRNAIAYAVRHWTPPAVTYVCLMGDATLDPKNYLGLGAPDLVPTYSDYYDPGLRHQFVADEFYSYLDGPGDLLTDVAVGRIPAGDPVEALRVLSEKTRPYETASAFDGWRARAILAADDAWKRELPDPNANEHVDQMERLDRDHLPQTVERAKIYLNDFAFADTTRQSKPAAREEFIAQLNRGAWLTQFIGHGSELVLADEQLFRASDAPRLTNADRPSLFGYFSCTVGKFDEPSGEGLAELLLTQPGGGAAMSIAATQETFGSGSTPFNDDFISALFPLAPRTDTLTTTGLAFAFAKSVNFTTSARKYVILGDPALRPPLPRGRGAWEIAPGDSVLRGEAVTLGGHAINPDGSPDTLSNGVADLLILGPPIARTQLATFNGSRTTYRVPGVTLFRGTVPLTQGAFEARFVVPIDGRVTGALGRLQALLSSAGGRGVGLAVDSIRIGAGAAPRTDATPPTIALSYPVGSDSTLQPGERLTIALEDSSGIDLTRLDNAHTIFVIVDDRGTPYEITPQFRYEPGSFTRGTVEFAVPALADGAHMLEVHASDTYRNIGVQRFAIQVAGAPATGSAVVLDQVFNYPNPFARETYLHARLNQPARLRIQVLTVSGRRVREIDWDGRTGENYIPWDGRDSEGENVAIGVYLFKVTAEAPTGARATAIGRALRTE